MAMRFGGMQLASEHRQGLDYDILRPRPGVVEGHKLFDERECSLMENAGSGGVGATVEDVFAALGETGLRSLVSRFYQRIPDDSILGPMYDPGTLEEAEERLADFLVFRTGGPQTYLSRRGPPRLRIRHAPFAITPAARDRWVALMDAALADCDCDPAIAKVLQEFLHQSATFLINRN